MAVVIERVDGRRGTARFIDVSWRVQDPAASAWVPPLRIMVKEMLDPRHDPFWKNADRALFIATREGRAVGRIAAIENRRHLEVHGDGVGFFGFFECIDDAEVARALFDTAADWLRGRGLERMRGPANPSLNHECGLLVEGFEEPPTLLTPWNPPWYEPLLVGAGLRKVRDTVAYEFVRGTRSSGLVKRIARRAREGGRTTIRPVDLSRIEEEADLIRPLYNLSWRDNWGFVPMTAEEFRFTAKSLKPLIRPRVTMVAERDGEPIGFFMVATDLNRILRRNRRGRLTPLALFRILVGRRSVDRARVLLLGITPDRRGAGALALFLDELIVRGHAEAALQSVEASWVLEDNWAMRKPLESLGIEPYRRWRLFEKELEA